MTYQCHYSSELCLSVYHLALDTETAAYLGCILLGFQNILNSEKGRLRSLRQPETKRMRIMKTAELEMKAIFIG